VSAIVALDHDNAEDWSESAKQLGKQLADKLPSMPSTAPESGARKDESALSGLERILPSNLGGTASRTAQSAKSDTNAPVAQVRLPVEVIDDYVLVRVQPMYPQVARQNNITGTVVLNTLIGRDGSVRDVRTVSGNKYLAEAAMAAVSQWRYKPFVLNGKPIEVATEVRIAFTRKPGQQRLRQ